jgi:hypothetical protein
LLPAQSFYAPYTQFEPSAKSDANRIAADVYASIQRSLSQVPSDQTNATWQIDPHSIRVSDVTLTPDRDLSFTVHFAAWSQNRRVELRWQLKASAPILPSVIIGFSEDSAISSHIVELHPTQTPPPNKDVPNISESNFLDQLFRPSIPSVLVPALFLSRAQEQRLQHFSGGRQGDPSGVSGEVGD